MTQEMTQGFVDRQGLLLAFGEAVDVGQDQQFRIAQLEIQLPTAAQLAQEQQQPPPEQKATVIGHQHLPASIRQLVGPGVELRAEVPDGTDEAMPQG
jgi:hypothetical protein